MERFKVRRVGWKSSMWKSSDGRVLQASGLPWWISTMHVEHDGISSYVPYTTDTTFRTWAVIIIMVLVCCEITLCGSSTLANVISLITVVALVIGDVKSHYDWRKIKDVSISSVVQNGRT